MKNYFQGQKVFSKRRELAIRKGILGVLDIGSSKITCFALELNDIRLDTGPPLSVKLQSRVQTIPFF